MYNQQILDVLRSIDKSLKSIAADIHPKEKKKSFSSGLTPDDKREIISQFPPVIKYPKMQKVS